MLSRYIRSWGGYKLHIGSNIPPKVNLWKEDKSSAPKVSFIRRFHCKGKSSWCFHVKKLLIIHIDFGHLNPENVTCLSAKEFQTITIAKLTDKANRKWKVWIWNPNAYSSDSGGRLHNYRVIKQTPSLESYLCRHYYRLQKTLVDHGCPLRGFPPTACWGWDIKDPIPPPNLQIKFCRNWGSFCNGVPCPKRSKI